MEVEVAVVVVEQFDGQVLEEVEEDLLFRHVTSYLLFQNRYLVAVNSLLVQEVAHLDLLSRKMRYMVWNYTKMESKRTLNTMDGS